MNPTIQKLYDELVKLLDDAPDVDDCSDEANWMYANMANLMISITTYLKSLKGEQKW